MPMIDRYKKPGGFLQLLILVETCGPQKQEKFLTIIQEEAPQWAELLRKKILTIERIFGWTDETLNEIVTRLQPLTLAIALQGMTPERQGKIVKLFSISLKRQVEDRKAIHASGPAEIATANIKILTDVREMASHGILRFDKFDPELAIEDNIEEALAHSQMKQDSGAEAPTESGTSLTFNIEPRAGAAAPEEMEFLRRKVAHLNSEISDLKRDNRLLAEKIQQIRKMAS